MVEFFQKMIDSNSNLIDVTNWVSELKFDSSNNYGPYGCAAFMREWNKVFKYQNRGKKPKGYYRYVIFEDFEIDMANNKPMPLARDESLYS